MSDPRRKLPSVATLIVAAALGVFWGGIRAGAATLHWDGVDLQNGGTGSWTTGGPLSWDLGVSGGADSTWTAGEDAVFGNVAGVVTLNSAVSANSLTFLLPSSGSYSLLSNSDSPAAALTLAGAASVTVDAGASATLGVRLGGTSGLTKLGSGTLVINGTSGAGRTVDYVGATVLSSGILSVGNVADAGQSSDLGAASAFDTDLVFDGGSLRFTGAANDATNRAFTVSPGKIAVIEVVQSAVTLAFSGAATTATTGGLSKTGAGTLTLSGSQSYSGATSVAAGTLALGASDRIADVSALTVASGASFRLNNFSETLGSLAGAGGVNLGTGVLQVGANNASTAFSGVISGSGGLTKTGSGVLTLSGASSYTGPTTLSSGTLSVSLLVNGGLTSAVGASSNSAANLVMDGGALLMTSGSSFSTNRSFSIVAGKTAIFDVSNAGTTATFSGATAATTGGILKRGSGRLNFSGTHVYTGSTHISQGVFSIGKANALSDSTAVTVDAGATFLLNGFNDTVGSVAGAGSISFGTPANVTLRAGQDNSSTSFSGVFSGGGNSATFVKLGTGALTLSGSHNYPVSVVVSGGRLVVANSGALGSATSSTRVDSNASLVLSGGVNLGAEPLSLSGSGISSSGALRNDSGNNALAGTVTLANSSTIFSDSGTLSLSGGISNGGSGNRTLTFSGSGSTAISGVIGGLGSGAVVKSGTGTLVLSGNNTYTGVVTVSAGVLRAENAGALGAGSAAVSVASGAALELNSPTGITLVSKPLSLAGTGVSGAGALRNISGNNAYPGLVTIQNAPLSARIQSDAGTLALGAINEAGSALKTLFFGGSGNITVNGVVSAGAANLNLVKEGSGVLRFAAANTHSGVVTLSGGVLAVDLLANGGSASGIGSSTSAAANLVINGGSLSYLGAAASTNRTFTLGVSGGGVSSNGSGPITFAPAAAVVLSGVNTPRDFVFSGLNAGDNVFSPDIGDNGVGKTRFIKEGLGKWILTAISGRTGATVVNEGFLVMNAPVPGSAVTVNATGRFGGTGVVGPLTLNSGAILSPGNGLASSGTLGAASLVWNGGAKMEFNLGSPGFGDRLTLAGALSKGSAGGYQFDFSNTGSPGSYTLITATSVTGFTPGDFSFINLPPGLSASFTLAANQVAILVIPEASPGILALAGGFCALAASGMRGRAARRRFP